MLNSMTIEQIRVLQRVCEVAIEYEFLNPSILTDEEIDTIEEIQLAIATKLHNLQEGR